MDEEGDRFCWICHREPSTLWCDTCPRSYHASCVNLKVRSLSEWVCPECVRVMAAENVDTRSPALALFSADEFCSLLQFALQRLKQHTHEAFLKPVCTKTYPKYTDYVSHPFDLSILEKNVRWKHYGCTESFLSDARWIYHNCIVFNGYNHKLTMSAKVLMKVCKQEMEDIEVCPDCYKNANTQESWFTEPCRRPHLLVWAKLKGFPYWPAKVMRLQDGNVDCRFFGAHDRAWVPMNQCFLLSKESPTDTKNRKKGLQNAIEELEIYVRKYREKFGEYRYSALRTTLTAEDFHCSKADPLVLPHFLVFQKDSETFGRSPRSELSSASVLLFPPFSDSPRKELWSGTPGSSREKSLASSAGSTPTRAEPRKENNQRMSSLTPKREPVSTKEERGFLPPLPDGAPQGIFEVSSELPGELQMKVSKEDMENLPKKVNRNVESLVSALKKIERSISSDRSSSIADAEDESSSDDRPLASTIGVPRKNGQSPSSCEVSSTTVTTEEGEVPSSQFATKDPLSAEEQPLAPIDDFQEKLKKTILSCKEKVRVPRGRGEQQLCSASFWVHERPVIAEIPNPERPFAALRKIEESIEQIRQECKEEMIEYHHILVHTNLILCRHPTSVYPRGMAMCSVPPVHQDLYNDMRAQFPELPDALIQSCVQLVSWPYAISAHPAPFPAVSLPADRLLWRTAIFFFSSYARNRSQCIEHLTRASQEQLYSQFDSEEASGNREGLRPAVSPRLFEPLEPPFPPDQDLPPPYPGVLAPVLAPASPQSPPMTPPHLPSPRLDQPPPRTDFWSQAANSLSPPAMYGAGWPRTPPLDPTALSRLPHSPPVLDDMIQALLTHQRQRLELLQQTYAQQMEVLQQLRREVECKEAALLSKRLVDLNPAQFSCTFPASLEMRTRTDSKRLLSYSNEKVKPERACLNNYKLEKGALILSRQREQLQAQRRRNRALDVECHCLVSEVDLYERGEVPLGTTDEHFYQRLNPGQAMPQPAPPPPSRPVLSPPRVLQSNAQHYAERLLKRGEKRPEADAAVAEVDAPETPDTLAASKSCTDRTGDSSLEVRTPSLAMLCAIFFLAMQMSFMERYRAPNACSILNFTPRIVSDHASDAGRRSGRSARRHAQQPIAFARQLACLSSARTVQSSACALHASLNTPFKDNVQRLYTEWVTKGQHALMPADKTRSSVELLCRWISEVWGVIVADVVVKSFKKTAVLNALDATADHLVWYGDEASEADVEFGGDDEATSPTSNVSSTDSD
ncbi:hypothetical protein HPB48_024398 [Haemaphysalis longicornis]|uniref:Protein kinase C-binding protein 1 n=1 Tax=Haemaphysalis longicornis TaxID=44386 RepID=A0A9J6H6B9_HAELO|nr:hypothetical protein HPB48_024398 [Haemaphysalis longicornis]